MESKAAAQEGELAHYRVMTLDGKHLPQEWRNMVLAKWMRSLRYGNDYFKMIDPEAYYENYRLYIAKILKTARLRFAVLGDNEDVVLGFAVHRERVLDYIWVDKDQRRRHLATDLLPRIEVYTHVTKLGLHLLKKPPYSSWRFNPFA